MTTVVGAEVVGADLSAPLDTATVAEIRAALLRWKVVFFRDQRLTPEQQLEFGRRFGAVTPAHPVVAPDGAHGHREILRLEHEVAAPPSGSGNLNASTSESLDLTRRWHTDLTFLPNPPMASILRAITVPPYGGDTMFSNVVAAYEALSPPVRRLVDGLQAVHRWRGFSGDAGRPAVESPRTAVHPVVRVHPETGERALFVNPYFTTHIAGLSNHESQEILNLLYHVAFRPDCTVRFRWEPHSVAFWDNRATAHVGPVDLEGWQVDRVVERITLVGDLPVGPDGFVSRALSGELFG
ncbi:TauD/TfdA dioxygenase family protein [Paractinoplanes hotanensis]|uniref:TauD/TfdA family dioxygenase n=1 Tax=Paractinoplanes hotanensis TaxID=2906497 RepID=A0ABT0YBW4_9ACTN|nr:TauD/TfdA family dioxygenase [Actinoplanes hotanensis]MCM4083534.1 TauD/TfdA family dioxygenase [Actinoplanes hotanensis]